MLTQPIYVEQVILWAPELANQGKGMGEMNSLDCPLSHFHCWAATQICNFILIPASCWEMFILPGLPSASWSSKSILTLPECRDIN